MNSNLKELKYYNLSWSDSRAQWGGFIGRYATKQQAQTELKKRKKENPYYDYEITEQSVLDLINHEREMAAIEEHNRMYEKIYNELYKKYQTELEQAIKKEKKRLQKEMKKIVKNWFETTADGGESYDS